MEKLHQNLVMESLFRRIKFQEIKAIEEKFQDFIRKFSGEKVLAAEQKSSLQFFINSIQAEIEYHNLNDDTYPHLNAIKLQMSTILDDLKSYYKTLSIIENVFEKKTFHRPIMLDYMKIQSMIW